MSSLRKSVSIGVRDGRLIESMEDLIFLWVFFLIT